MTATRHGVILRNENETAVEIEEIRCWKQDIVNNPGGPYEYLERNYYLERPLTGKADRKGNTYLLKITCPDGTVMWAEKVWDHKVHTREDDLENLRRIARDKIDKALTDAEKKALGLDFE